jgi:predicted phage-related endonuclease
MPMTDLDAITTLSASSVSLVEELRSTREFIKSLKAREKEIRSILLKELRDSSLGVTASGKYVIEVERHTRTGLDADRLQALYEEAWEDCQTETEVEVLRLVQEDVDTSEFTE